MSLRIGFVSSGSPRDIKSWSGTPYRILSALESQFGEGVTVFDTPLLDNVVAKFNRVMRPFGQEILREKWSWKFFSYLTDRWVQRNNPEIMFSVLSAHKVAGMKSNLKIVYFSDALFGTIVNYYPQYGVLSERSIRLGNDLMQRVIDKSSLIIVSSDWAREDALERYRIDPDKIQVVPLGANVDSIDVIERTSYDLQEPVFFVCRH